jgi:tetratricopeptide (TPR) repeat protein
MKEPGRNDPCSCGSGKKYKKCCLGRSRDRGSAARPGTFEEVAADLARLDETSNLVPDLLDRGRIEEAEAVAARLLAEYPDEPDGLERMAEVLEAKGENVKAAEYYRRAAQHHLKQDPVHGREPADHYLAKARELDPAGHPDAAGG